MYDNKFKVYSRKYNLSDHLKVKKVINHIKQCFKCLKYKNIISLRSILEIFQCNHKKYFFLILNVFDYRLLEIIIY